MCIGYNNGGDNGSDNGMGGQRKRDIAMNVVGGLIKSGAAQDFISGIFDKNKQKNGDNNGGGGGR